MGLATIADVLQARTAASQAQLDLQTTEGNVQTARGALALALGLPANLPYDVDSTAAAVPVRALADSVDRADRVGPRRPAGPGGRALGGRGGARRHRRGAGEPAALAQPQRHRRPHLRHHDSRTAPTATTSSLGLTIPLFNGFSRQYDLRAAEYQAEAASARSETVRQQVVYPGVQRLLRAADLHPARGHGGGPPRERTAVERGRAGAVQGRRGQRARPAGGPERARERAGAAGGRPAGLERLAGAAGARRRRARPQGRDLAPTSPPTPRRCLPDDRSRRACSRVLCAFSVLASPARRRTRPRRRRCRSRWAPRSAAPCRTSWRPPARSSRSRRSPSSRR